MIVIAENNAWDTYVEREGLVPYLRAEDKSFFVAGFRAGKASRVIGAGASKAQHMSVFRNAVDRVNAFAAGGLGEEYAISVRFAADLALIMDVVDAAEDYYHDQGLQEYGGDWIAPSSDAGQTLGLALTAALENDAEEAQPSSPKPEADLLKLANDYIEVLEAYVQKRGNISAEDVDLVQGAEADYKVALAYKEAFASR